MTSSRTVLIEANRLFRDGLKHLLASTEFAIGAEFGTMDQAVDGAVPSALVIVGQSDKEPGDAGRLRDAYPDAHIVVLASDLSVDALRDAMGAGIAGFLMKDISPEALVQSLHLIMMGEKVFPTNLASMLMDMNSQPSPLNSVRGLTTREREILQSLVGGASNKLIANRLGITEATIKVHLKTLLRKLDVNNRTQAAIWAMNNGFGAETAATPTRHLQAVSA
ncbi:hypothetical protein N825_32145 [Skermanella stibiiresistens SB22]|uniref:Transcriptional regulator n=1 Tax=Skermanella stibiiresistens SB22 TaxID=1385369 RepID=W9GWU1_9PROT|nr:response regulator transcription factor [Skermanella stibiiresistens]EWY35953.1 hypothetical protein N825_32145 [Skermanella stibiiresistens SB22]